MKIHSKVIELCKQIQQIPAPTFHEQERAKFVKDLFSKEGLKDVHQNKNGNVYGYLPGISDEEFLVVSAHLDTVFPIETNLEIKQDGDKLYGPGIGDNSLGVAGLFGLIWMLKNSEIILPGGIWFCANVCEEGLGDLKGMRDIVDKFGDKPKGYVILEGVGYSQIYHRGLGVKRYEISVTTEGGHSWGNFGQPSAIHEIAKFVNALMNFEIPNKPRTSFNVGIIEGGTSINTIAAEARIELDLRSESNQELIVFSKKVEEWIQDQKTQGVEFNIKVIGDRPSGEIFSSHPLVNLAAETIIVLGDEPLLLIGSTDANIPLSLGYPAITIGLTNGGGVHTVNEFIDTTPLKKGLIQLFEIVIKVWSLDKENK